MAHMNPPLIFNNREDYQLQPWTLQPISPIISREIFNWLVVGPPL